MPRIITPAVGSNSKLHQTYKNFLTFTSESNRYKQMHLTDLKASDALHIEYKNSITAFGHLRFATEIFRKADPSAYELAKNAEVLPLKISFPSLLGMEIYNLTNNFQTSAGAFSPSIIFQAAANIAGTCNIEIAEENIHRINFQKQQKLASAKEAKEYYMEYEDLADIALKDLCSAHQQNPQQVLANYAAIPLPEMEAVDVYHTPVLASTPCALTSISEIEIPPSAFLSAAEIIASTAHCAPED